MALTHDDKDALATVIREQLQELRLNHWIEPELHARHHAWVNAKVRREADLRKALKKIALSACIWAVPILLAFLGGAIWHAVVDLARSTK